MPEIGSIWVTIGAKLDQFEAAMNRVKQHCDDIGRKFQDVGKQFMMVGGAITGALGLIIEKTATTGNEFYLLAQKTGVSVASLSSLQGACAQAGLQINDLALGFRFLSRNMEAAATTNKPMAIAFSNFGGVIDQNTGKLKPLDQMLFTIADRFKEMKDGPEKAAMAIQLFGRSGTQMIPLLNLGSEGLRNEMMEATRLGVAFDDLTAKKAHDFIMAQHDLKESLAGVGKEISLSVMPSLIKLAGQITEQVVHIREWIDSHQALVSTLVMLVLKFGTLLTAFGALNLAIGTIIRVFGNLSVMITNLPWTIAIVGIGLVVAKLWEMKAAIDAANAAEDRFNERQNEQVDLLSKAAVAAKMHFGEMSKLITAYQGNTNALVRDIVQGKYGLELKNALVKVTKEHFQTLRDEAAAADKSGEAFATAALKTKVWSDELGVMTKLQIEAKIAAISDALTDEAKVSQLTAGETQKLKDDLQALYDKILGYSTTIVSTALPATRQFGQAIIDNAKGTDIWLTGLPDLRKEITLLGTDEVSTAKVMAQTSEDVGVTWKETTKQIQNAWEAGLLGMMEGTKTFGDLIKNVFSALGSYVASAINKLITGVLTSLGAMAGPIGAIVGAIAGSLISLVGNLLGSLFKSVPKITQEQIKTITDMVGRAKATMYLNLDTKQAEKAINSLKNELAMMTNEMGGQLSVTFGGEVSGGTLEAIAKDRQRGLEGYVAENKHLADIIKDVGVNQGNLNTFWQKTNDIIDEMKSGVMGASDGIKALGDSFTLMVEGARKLGAEGGQGMVDFIRKLRAAGLEVPEVTAYVIGELQKIPDALNTIVSNISTTAPRAASDLAGMGRIAVASFQAMLANGMTFLQALDAMSAPLQAMVDKYKAAGLAIPDFLKPLLDMQALSKKFPEAFQNMSAGLQILNSLRNSAYLTQDTFNSLISVVETFAHKILGTSGSLRQFMDTSKLTQTQIQALLPIVSQFVGAAAIFGLAVPSWMHEFVTKQLGVDWNKFQEASKAMAGSGIATVEKLQMQIDKAKIYDDNNKDRFKNLVDNTRQFFVTHADRMEHYFSDLEKTIIGLPHAASGGYFSSPALVQVAENEPEIIVPVSKLESNANANVTNNREPNLRSGVENIPRQLTVDWSKLQEASKAITGSGIATIEKLQAHIGVTQRADENNRDRFKNLIDNTRDFFKNHTDRMGQYFSDLGKTIIGMPHAETGGYFSSPGLVHVAESEPEWIVPASKMESNRNVNVNLSVDNQALDLRPGVENILIKAIPELSRDGKLRIHFNAITREK